MKLGVICSVVVLAMVGLMLFPDEHHAPAVRDIVLLARRQQRLTSVGGDEAELPLSLSPRRFSPLVSLSIVDQRWPSHWTAERREDAVGNDDEGEDGQDDASSKMHAKGAKVDFQASFPPVVDAGVESGRRGDSARSDVSLMPSHSGQWWPETWREPVESNSSVLSEGGAARANLSGAANAVSMTLLMRQAWLQRVDLEKVMY